MPVATQKRKAGGLVAGGAPASSACGEPEPREPRFAAAGALGHPERVTLASKHGDWRRRPHWLAAMVQDDGVLESKVFGIAAAPRPGAGLSPCQNSWLATLGPRQAQRQAVLPPPPTTKFVEVAECNLSYCAAVFGVAKTLRKKREC